ncbi:MAG: pantetheine-phosphate adenylyltransferase [candidate division WOR-3 bacterium]|nr:pantetheine-phosphate adenylyltransferase [candidate division WOR-3 bacterium]MDH5684106.1 pantetheine-phosphate adenylyltransferase [candidate division WOR-3 bacterium]
MKIAVYPGSFDPITNGHIDIVKRAAKIFDRIIVAVARREQTKPLFTLEERVALANEVLGRLENVEVTGFSNLLIDFVRAKKACTIIRGIRAVVDFDYEFQMVVTNRKLDPRIETIFFMPSAQYFYLSASLVKEIAALGGRVSCFVPSTVVRNLKKKFTNCY